MTVRIGFQPQGKEDYRLLLRFVKLLRLAPRAQIARITDIWKRLNEDKEMKQGHFAEHWLDRIDILEPDGARINKPVPAGGVSTGRGFTISWQNGPLGRDNARKEPNGAFVEDVIQAVIERIEFYQQYFPCQENADALEGLYRAAQRLDDRTREREARQVEGTHTA